MKKKNAAGRPAPKRKAATVDAYFARVPGPALGMLKQMRAAIRSVVPPATTETISYQIPAFKHGGVLVWYGAFRDHCSLFPGGSVLAAFRDELKGLKTAKGTVQFPLDTPLPVALVKRIVKARVDEVAAKKRR